MFGSFQETDAEDRPVYAELPSYEELRRVLSGKLAEYNELNASMDLVLFQQASMYSCHNPVPGHLKNGYCTAVVKGSCFMLMI